MKINTISPQEHKYLQILTNIAKCPENLYYIGNLPSNRTTSVAIVGTRKPTSYGKDVTYKISYDLAKKGVVIISGLAYGVDTIAHQAALDAGGCTIAVLANGVDIIYPASNKRLYERIIESGGAIVSEYKPGTRARLYTFLERNRIVSGLSDALLVTEAAIKSGTISTVNRALEQGREVMVVPGNITSPMSMGCNRLIKQGAMPIASAEEIIETINPNLLNTLTQIPLGNNKEEALIINILSSGVRDGDELFTKSKLELIEFTNTLTMMEINGQIRSIGGNQWTLK